MRPARQVVLQGLAAVLPVGIRVAQVPQPLMGRDQAFDAAAAAHVPGRRASHQHQVQRAKQAIRHHEVVDVAGMVESDEYLVRQAAALTENPANLTENPFVQRNQCLPPFPLMACEGVQPWSRPRLNGYESELP